MKIKNVKLFALALSGVVSLTSLTGCGEQKYHEEKGCEFTRQFDVGEHIISMPLKDDIRKKTVQIETYPGYEIAGVSFAAYGSASSYGGGVIVYVNDEIVECKSNLYDENGEYVYLDFGTPLDYVEESLVSNDEVREFEVGEHVISIPLSDDIRKETMQYEYHPGYEVVGVSVAAYGSASSYGGASIIYKNVVPVRAEYQEDGESYTTFGETIEREQVKGLN